ncbi:ATP-binding protein [Granulicoccus phenolivorans]|uniref:ATP-binding protein n=1 Tax=Granulicoccus phenolivorans TaxID=266854 RepID=UPI00040D212A|nr:LuxR C-terminal-related transcriptional regulator [Granulicoccus phenolivorans]
MAGDAEILFGRQEDLATVTRLLESSRLVTITGPGGIGKTSLAVRITEHLRPTVVDLTAIHSAGEVAAQIARTLGVSESSARPPQEQVARHLGAAPALLLLDNCEHVADGVADFLTAVLPKCSGLRVLTTSTVVLEVRGEQVYELPPLSVPAPTDDFARILEHASVQVLIARTRAVAPGFEVTEENCQQVAELCRRLDGMPLAVELAAIRLRVLSVDELTKRLDHRFALLNHGNRNAPDRHRTLRALVAWSFERCSPAERLLWARLSVFRGSFSLDAAEHVCTSPDVAPEDILDVIDGLVAKSVLVVDRATRGQVRYRQLATIRDYGTELLTERGERAMVHDRLLEFCLDRADQRVASWCSDSQATSLRTWRVEHPTILAAFEWAMEDPSRHNQAAELMVQLRYHWIAGGQLSDGRRWADRILNTAELPAVQRGHVLAVAAWIALIQGDRESARAYLDEAEPLRAATGDEFLGARLEAWTGLLLLFSGQVEAAVDTYARAIPVLSAHGDDGSAQMATFQMAMAQVYSDRLDDALATCRDQIAWCRSTGEQWDLAYALWVQGIALWRRGESDAARTSARQALQIQESFEDGICIALVLLLLTWIMGKRSPQSRQLSCAADRVWQILGTSAAAFGPHLHRHHQQFTPPPLTGGTPPRTRGEAVTLGLALSEPTSAKAASNLTAREEQVLTHLVEGRSNREIAAELVLSPRTVEGHVENVLAKLHLRSRAEVPAWFVRHRDPGAVVT